MSAVAAAVLVAAVPAFALSFVVPPRSARCMLLVCSALLLLNSSCAFCASSHSRSSVVFVSATGRRRAVDRSAGLLGLVSLGSHFRFFVGGAGAASAGSSCTVCFWVLLVFDLVARFVVVLALAVLSFAAAAAAAVVVVVVVAAAGVGCICCVVACGCCDADAAAAAGFAFVPKSSLIVSEM